MPRLPGPEALGNLPSLRSGIRPAQMSGQDATATALGRAGEAMVKLSEDERQREEALQVAEADAELSTRLQGLRRRFETDPDWRTFQPRFDEEAERIRTEAGSRIQSPRVRERWQPRSDVAIANSFDHVRGRQDRMRGEHEYERLDRVLTDRVTSYLGATDDADRERQLQDIQDTIELGRRSGVISPERLRDLRRRHYYGALEQDAMSRHNAGDGYATLLELREGDARARTPSTGQVSELGLAFIERGRQRPQGETTAETQAAQRRNRTEAAALSRWISENVRTPEGETIPLTQLQHDALVGLAIRRGRDALQELIPSIQTGNWESVSRAVRAGGLTNLEQPAPPPGTQERTPLGEPGAGRRVFRFSDDVDRAIIAAADQHGIDPDLLRRIAAIESGGNARAVRGSYRGLFQLSEDEFGGRGDIFNPADNASAAAASLVRRIADFRGQHGRDPTAGELYLMHQQGAGGLSAHMADPNRLAWESMFSTAEGRRRGREWARAAISGNLPPDVLRSLGGVDQVTSQQFMDYWRRRVEGDSRTPPGETPPPEPGRDEMADMILGQAPSSRYARLPPDRRRVIIRQLGESMRNETRTEIENDIESIRRTGQPRTLPDGTTWIDRGRRILVPNHAALMERRVREAYMQFRALQGLPDMNPEEMERRLDDLNPGSEGNAENYAAAARTRDQAARQIGRIQELRNRDPARAVSGANIQGGRGGLRMNADGNLHNVPADDDIRVTPAREITAVFEMLRRRRPDLNIEVTPSGELTTSTPPGQLDRERARPQTLRLTDPRLSVEERTLLIEARLAAMSRLGISETNRRILTGEEAAHLLNMPPRDADMTDAQYQARLRAAADRAAQLFGPRYQRAAFEAAIAFRTTNNERRMDAREMANRLRLSGDRLEGFTDPRRTEEEVERLRIMSRLDREEAAWRYGQGVYTPTTPGLEELGFGPGYRGGTAQPWRASPEEMAALQRPEDSNVTPGPTSGTTVSRRRPTPERIDHLRRHPRLWREFDIDFGKGAAAEYLRE